MASVITDRGPTVPPVARQSGLMKKNDSLIRISTNQSRAWRGRGIWHASSLWSDLMRAHDIQSPPLAKGRSWKHEQTREDAENGFRQMMSASLQGMSISHKMRVHGY